MSQQLLVGLCGPAGCGKDTVAAMMPTFRRYALASPIKHALNTIFGWSMEHWDDRVWKETPIEWLGKSPRQMAQTLGTEWGRQQVHRDLWLKLGVREWNEVRQTANPRLVITDVRFDNEASAIIMNGGSVWKVEREGMDPVAAHTSESGISPALIEGVVKNYGSLDELRISVEEWCRFLHRRYAK